MMFQRVYFGFYFKLIVFFKLCVSDFAKILLLNYITTIDLDLVSPSNRYNEQYSDLSNIDLTVSGYI